MNNQIPEATVGGESSDSQATAATPVFNTRELATVLASLRYWQREGLLSERHELNIATKGGELSSLSVDEIDSLCERLNFLELRADIVDGHPVSDEYTADHVSAVAEKFLQHLERDLGSQQVYALVCLQNLVESNPLVCHSHDHLDANMTMAGAVAEVLGIEPDDVDVQNVHVTALWNKAWNLAFHGMREIAQTKLLEVSERVKAMQAVHDLAPSLGLGGREAVMAAGQLIFGDTFADSDVVEYVVGLNGRNKTLSTTSAEIEAPMLEQLPGMTWTHLITRGSADDRTQSDLVTLTDGYLLTVSATEIDVRDRDGKHLKSIPRHLGAAVANDERANPSLGNHISHCYSEHTGGGCMVDVFGLTDGKCLILSDEGVGLYPTYDALYDDDGAIEFMWLDEAAVSLAKTPTIAPQAVEVPQGSSNASGGLKTAIEALRLAAECGGDLDKPFYKDALAGLIRVNSQVLAYDASLNAREEAPTGSDFNEVFGMLGLDPKSVVDPTAEKWGAMRSSLREELQSATKVQGKTGVAEQLAILQAAMEHISQGGVQYSTDARELTVMAKEALKDAGLAPVRAVSNSRDDGPSP